MAKPLANFKVLDLSRVLAGPFATQLLADLGAEVIKVEGPDGDPTRGWGPPFEEGESAYFRCANRGKRSLGLDLSLPGDRARLAELMDRADVLVENCLPDTIERLGLGWDALHARHPKLIVASVRGFASDLPVSRRPGYDFIIQAASGLMGLTGEAEGRPMKVGVAITDVLCALYLANGIQAALLHRERSGEALHIEVPLMEAALAGLVNAASSTLMTGQAPPRLGNAHPNIVPYQAFACRDGEVALGVGSDRQFEVLALWLGLDLEEEPRWRENRGRVEDRARLVPRIESRLAALDLDEVVVFCEAHAIPVSRIRRIDEALFEESGRLHRLIQPLFDPVNGKVQPSLASPILLNGERACSPLPPPRRPK